MRRQGMSDEATRLVKELCQKNQIGYATAISRLRAGWSLEDATALPVKPHCGVIAEKKKIPGVDAVILFTKRIPGVFMDKQPVIGKQYDAKQYTPFHSSPYCIFHLDDGHPMIAYPGEYMVVSCAE